MDAESEKRRRLSLTKAQLHEEKGSALLALLADIVADGKLTDDEIQRLGVWLNDNRDSEMPAIHFLLDCVNGIVARGQLFEADRTELFIGIEKVLPLTERGIAKQAREHAEMEVKKRFGKVGAKITRDDLKRMIEETKENPEPPPKRHANWRDDPMSEPQLHFIRSLGGSISSSATKGEASDLIDQLLRNKPVSNRHQMVLRFWNRTIGSDEGPREITEWLDAFYTEDPDRKLAWELFKEESGDDGTQREPGRVPIGIGPQYLARIKAGGSRPIVQMPTARRVEYVRLGPSRWEYYVAAGIGLVAVALLGFALYKPPAKRSPSSPTRPLDAFAGTTTADNKAAVTSTVVQQNPDDETLRYMTSLTLSGIFGGVKPRAIINGNGYAVGEIIDYQRKISLSSIDQGNRSVVLVAPREVTATLTLAK